jgi:ZIP family zinc transporter
MSTAEILGLGAVAGLTIYLGLPLGRVRGVSQAVKTFFAATATGILIFLLWDVLAAAVEPVEGALSDGRTGRFA